MNEKSITTITLKKINKKSVYQYIYEHRQTAKQQIVQDLTMGLSTVSQNLNVLEKEGLISRDGFFESTGGRKAQVIQIVPEYRIAVGVGILKSSVYQLRRRESRRRTGSRCFTERFSTIRI